MPETLLRTKLFVPPLRPTVVRRPPLIERLNEGLALGHKLTLISAPAGFGKTTLVSEWIGGLRSNTVAESDNRIAWLSLDENDNDPTRFLTYFVAALSQIEGIEGNIGKEAQSILQSPQPLPAEPILISLINDITAIPGGLLLVLDDYHLINSSPVDDAVAFLLEHLPPQMHLIIATRIDPDLSLARLRARGQLTELRAIDLRFTSIEAAEFLNRVMRLNLSAEDIATLETRTEGWIAGLQLAAISMRGQKDTSSLIESFTGSHRFVLDYLVDEVLDRQPESVQAFLLQTAIVDRLTGSLCDALTGHKDGKATLEMLQHANLFIIPLDDERRWYRYHHLFADLLRRRLRRREPRSLPVLHTKAGEWFNEHGFNREAISHSLKARNYQRAAEMIRAIAVDIIQQGEHTTVAGWIDVLPEGFVKERPYLCVLHAWALQLSGDLETSETRLLEAENALNGKQYQEVEDSDAVRGLIHSHRAYMTFMTGKHDKTVFHAHQALDQLPETATLIRAQTALYLGIAYRYKGQLRAALDIYNETLPITQRMGGKSIAVLCYLHLGDLYGEMAQLHKAKALCEQALQFTEQHTGRPDRSFSGYAYVSIGRILRQWNQLEDAYSHTARGVDLCRDWNVADIMALSCIELAYTDLALGNDEQASESIKEAIQIYDGFSPWGVKYGGAHRAKMDLQRGDIDAAGRWAQASDLAVDGDFEYHREIEYTVLTRVLIAQKRFEEARALAERIYRVAQDTEKKQTELEGLVLLALILSAQGETDQALVCMEKALSIGEPEGYMRIFVDEGPPMAHLLNQALNKNIAPEYVRRLLAAFPLEESPQGDGTKFPADQSQLIEPLSDRELEVLQHIADGLTNREIADRLYLSLNTVKVHSRNIYGKLGVHNRTQAVARASALGILPST